MKLLSINSIKKLMLAFSVVILMNSCSTISTESSTTKNLEGVNMTTIELNIRLNEFEKYFMGTVEAAADEIISSTDQRQIKMNALEWKINIFPRVMESLVILDPRAVGTDLYALSGQMLNFFKTGDGKNLFGDYQYIAVDACEDIFNDIENLVNAYRDEKYREQSMKVINEWIKENPIEDLQFHRRSTFDLMAKTLGSEKYDLGATVGNLTEAVHDIRRQISVYAGVLPKQTKWEAQLISYEVFGDSSFEKSMNNLDKLVDDINRITKVIEESPGLLTEIQKSTLEELHKELLLTLSTLENERAIILSELKDERVAVMLDINQQRMETLQSLEKLTEQTINQSSVVAGDLVDKIFIKTIILLILVFLGILFIVRFAKKKV